MQAVFMVGEQRSGSNLLRLILNESGDITSPHPPHILQRLMPITENQPLLGKQKNFKKLIDGVCRMVETNPVAWTGLKLDREDIYRRCRQKSLVAIFGAVMDSHAESQGARIWVCKSLQNIRWAEQLDAYFGFTKYIYLYRDPRDVALSFMKAVVGEKHPYFIARQWDELQRLCLQQARALPADRFHMVSYEQLTTRPEATVTELCRFLDIEFNEKMLEFHTSREASRAADSSALWKNVSTPIMSGNSRKFETAMAAEDLAIIEAIAADTMAQLGYDLLNKDAASRRFSDAEIAAFGERNEKAKQEVLAHTEKEDIERRQRQNQVVAEIAGFVKSLGSGQKVA
jgi:hypothetical protein